MRVSCVLVISETHRVIEKCGYRDQKESTGTATEAVTRTGTASSKAASDDGISLPLELLPLL